MNYTIDDILVTCIARQIHDGEVVTQGIATPLTAAAYLLARRTHAPNLYFTSAIGQGMCREPAPLSIAQVEKLWLDRALSNIGFARAAVEILTSLRMKEFFRPAQVDAHGNFNNIAFGKDIRHPRLRLPGTGGIPDVTTFASDVCLYVPRHSRLTFTPTLDFCAGLGHHPARTQGAGPVYLVSDLGQFDFAHGRLRLITCHPGVTVEHIQARTGFEIELAPQVETTPPPTQEDLSILEEIDPLGIRRLEGLSGAPRHALLRDILRHEAAAAS